MHLHYILVLSLSCAAPLAAQSMVEAGALAGVAIGGSRPAAKTGAALGRTLGKLETSLSGKPSGQATSSRSSLITLASDTPRQPSPPPPPKPSKADFDSIAPGLSRSELIAKVGLPAISIMSSEGEILSYACKEGDAFTVKVAEGKVASIIDR